MLGNRKRFAQNVSFTVDMAVSLILLLLVFWFLQRFNQQLHTVAGFFWSGEVRVQSPGHIADYGWFFSILMVSSALCLRWSDCHMMERFVPGTRLFMRALKAVTLALGLTIVMLYLFQIGNINRSLLIGFGGAFLGYYGCKIVFLRSAFFNERARRKALPVLVVTTAEKAGAELRRWTSQAHEWIVPEGMILASGGSDEVDIGWREKVQGGVEDLAHLLATGRFAAVFVSLPEEMKKEAREVVSIAEEQGIEVWHFTEFARTTVAKPQLDEYEGRPVVVYKTTSTHGLRLFVKRAMDIVFSAAFLVVFSPLIVLLMVAIKTSSKGPLFYTQMRTGLRGKPFRMIKFRTMEAGAEGRLDELKRHNEMSGPVFKMKEDPRVTTLGRFMRRHSLDEIPQFWNVLRGEMSLVGPRPLPVYETERFPALRDRRRYSVMPGLTCLWQISGRNKIHEFEEWVKMDLEYIDQWSLRMDLGILLRTPWVILTGRGAR